MHYTQRMPCEVWRDAQYCSVKAGKMRSTHMHIGGSARRSGQERQTRRTDPSKRARSLRAVSEAPTSEELVSVALSTGASDTAT